MAEISRPLANRTATVDQQERKMNKLLFCSRALHPSRLIRVEAPRFLNSGFNPEFIEAPQNPVDIASRIRSLRRPIKSIPLNILFDANWYRQNYIDKMEYVDAWTDYKLSGFKEKRNPNFLFHSDYYLSSYRDVAESGQNPLVHYINHGAWEGRNPSPLFDSQYYLKTYVDVAQAGLNPLYHFLASGWREGRNPSAAFDVLFYLESNPDVAASGMNPVDHYIQHGRAGGRLPRPRSPERQPKERYVPPNGLLPWFDPLNLEIDQNLSNKPHLNVLVPGLAMKHMSGGPNTALNLAGRLAGMGIPVRFCSTNAPIDADSAPFWAHVRRLADLGDKPIDATLVDWSNRMARPPIGENDIFLATAWWTAQMAKYAVQLTRSKTFIYLIQDYEPLLHAASSPYAMAQETYGLDHIGIINTALLHEFLTENAVGRYADPEFAEKALVFNPAVDRSLFHPIPRRHEGKRRLLFYARPTNGLRNLFEIGTAALQKCLFEGHLDPDRWEFIGMGEQFAPFDLGHGAKLEAAPWHGLDGYASQMRESDLLISLMASPHPSYPPIEMALCGRPVVTNVFANKTAERLSKLSPNIIGCEATIDSIAEGIQRAVTSHRLDSGGGEVLPGTWDEAFEPILPALRDRLLALMGAPEGRDVDSALISPSASQSSTRAVGFRNWPQNGYEITKYRRQAARADAYPDPEPELISFLTTVYDTPAPYLDELAESVFAQDCGTGFEWVLLDNGSSHPETLAAMARIAQHSCVRFLRVEKNLGIIGGMRHILKLATRRYIVPLDSDDILTPDCVRIITASVRRNGYPLLAYTDEDKMLEGIYRDPYDKPSWDPVLFFHSCYIAHLGCIDRERALELGVYDDDNVSGCHDYDTFTRFYIAGHTPLHIPELVYTWRMHAASTAGNIASKNYISSSQLNLLRKFLNFRAPEITVEASPLFNGTPDWHFRNTRQKAPKVVTFAYGQEDVICPPSGEAHKTVDLGKDSKIQLLARALEDFGDDVLCHLHWRGCEIANGDWIWEAATLMTLFPDTAVVGGAIEHARDIVAAPGFFGFGRGCDSPDIGRSANDPGYFAQMFKEHSVDCVPMHHAVIKATFLREALKRLGSADLSICELGPWLGALAADAGLRTVYSPFLRAHTATKHPPGAGDAVFAGFRAIFGARYSSSRYLSRNLSRSIERPYRAIVPREEIGRELAPIIYADRQQAERLARQFSTTEVRASLTVGLMTSVYEKTHAGFLQALIDSVEAQDSPVTEWVILENGPIKPDVAAVLAAAEKVLPLRRFRVEKNLGIQGAMAFCLGKAEAEIVAPLDADDLIEPDAVRQIRLANAQAPFDLAYSDEDHIINGVLQAPFRRAALDSILNATDSYVWHMVFFRRSRALELGLYQSAGAEYCHDWDTLTRFVRAGARIRHIPHVLYHWRMHEASTSGSGSVNSGTTMSVRWMLEQQIAATKQPECYRVAEFPLDRGVPQLSILRTPAAPLPMITCRFPATPPAAMEAASLAKLAHLTLRHLGGPDANAIDESPLREVLAGVDQGYRHVLFKSDDVEWPSPEGMLEAMRLFEMHPEVGALGGRIFEINDRILEASTLLFRDEQGKPIDITNMRRNDPGSFALALKPQYATGVPTRLFFVRRDVLESLLDGDAPFTLDMVAGRIREEAGDGAFRCAYSPLIESRKL